MYKLFKNNKLNQEFIEDLDSNEDLTVLYNGNSTNNTFKTINNFIFNSESENYNENFE